MVYCRQCRDGHRQDTGHVLYYKSRKTTYQEIEQLDPRHMRLRQRGGSNKSAKVETKKATPAEIEELARVEDESKRNEIRRYSERFFNNGEGMVPQIVHSEIAEIARRLGGILDRLVVRERAEINEILKSELRRGFKSTEMKTAWATEVVFPECVGRFDFVNGRTAIEVQFRQDRIPERFVESELAHRLGYLECGILITFDSETLRRYHGKGGQNASLLKMEQIFSKFVENRVINSSIPLWVIGLL